VGALPTELRNQLSKACVAAREEAEKGARAALQALAVHHHEPHGSMTLEQRALRNRLRAHGRQLGDMLDQKRGTQTIDRLVHECAYEHWHRMLFARFLAENHLLIEPTSGVAITMEECEELARDAGEDPWALASRFAQRMLPQIFRPDDPVLAVGLPPETRQALERLLADLPAVVFTADDALGWTYQFWQSAEKDRVNASGEKITGATLPAVTQLFTEHYMVLFLLHNTIGAWHAGKVLAQRPGLANGATSEQELRDAVALDDYQFEYLRFVRESQEGDEEDKPTGSWRPAAGTFDGWPKRAAELTVLDPCCGSGHFLVEVFFLLVRLRMAEEGMSPEDALRAVLKENVCGLELDTRCTQIAAFNLALAAWRMVGKVVELPSLRVSCCGLGPSASLDEWLQLAEPLEETLPRHAREPVRNGLANLHNLFSQAQQLGSLIDPEALPGDLIAADYETLRPFLSRIMSLETMDEEARERATAALGLADAAEILVGPEDGYCLVATNVPYRQMDDLDDEVARFVKDRFPAAKSDIGTAFYDRLDSFLRRCGASAVVVPQGLLYKDYYAKFRKQLFQGRRIPLIARLGAGAFREISGEEVKVCLVVAEHERCRSTDQLRQIDATSGTPDEKERTIKDAPLDGRQQNQALISARFVVAMGGSSEFTLLEEIAWYSNGIQTGDYPRFGRCFWEVPVCGDLWTYQLSTVTETRPFGGREHVLLWENGAGQLHEYVASKVGPKQVASWIRGLNCRHFRGVAISAMGELKATRYSGELFDDNTVVIIPKRPNHLEAIWRFCSSDTYNEAVRKVDQSSKVRGALLRVPFDVPDVCDEEEVDVACESTDPTQWLFHGHACNAESVNALQVAVARLVGYRWPAELDAEMLLSDRTRALAAKCEELCEFADDDGIVCLWPARSESPAANRLRALLAAAFGDVWSASKERELLQAAADEFNKGKAAKSLEDWLVDRFFEEHCKLFQHRPFVWHVWDGRTDGFNALVNYHKLAGPDGEGRRTLESLTFSYLATGSNGSGPIRPRARRAPTPAWLRRSTYKSSSRRSSPASRRTTSSSAGSHCTSSRSAGSRTSTTACG
jgi:hypothetical protein